MSYIDENLLLENETAKILYNMYAKKEPIFDYHCHLNEKMILDNKPFEDIFELWLAGDHYKWRLMRNYGISEEYITGNRSKKEKFIKYCEALGEAYGNPLYHWSQMELKEYFDCEEEINLKNSEFLWNYCNQKIKEKELTPVKIIEQSNVKYIFTTNEIMDDLSTFEKIKQKNYGFTVLPAFRAEKIMNIESKDYLDYIKILEKTYKKIESVKDLEEIVEARLKDFIQIGTVASDIALEKIYDISEYTNCDKIFKKILAGKIISKDEVEIFKGYFTYFLIKTYSKNNIIVEIHIGARRNNNTLMFEKLGLDSGFDAISSEDSSKNLALLMDRLNNENSLPKTILFNLNPKMNFEFISLLGCFQDSVAFGKIQLGAAWWFLDNKNGIIENLKSLSAVGHIAVFLGMLTDSRSFLSYARHHYFRRILCSYLGNQIESNEMTKDLTLVGKTIQNICYNNSKNYFVGEKNK